jgi:hypothetical protein
MSESRRHIIYVFGSDGRVAEIGDLPYTHVVLAFLHLRREGDSLQLLYGDRDVSSRGLDRFWSEVRELRERHGKTVLVSIGGRDSDGDWRLVEEHTDGAVDLVARLVARHDLDGVDLDMESDFSDATVELTNRLANAMPDLIITHAPPWTDVRDRYASPYGSKRPVLERTASARKSRGNNIDWLNVQFYDKGQVADPVAAYASLVSGDAAAARIPVPPGMMALGLMPRSDREVRETCAPMIRRLARTYPDCAGVFAWRHATASKTGWPSLIAETLWGGRRPGG